MSKKRIDPAIRTKSERESERWRQRVRDANKDVPSLSGAETVTGVWTFTAHPLGLSHLLIANIGTNTHIIIDIHIADTSIHFPQTSITTVGTITSGTWQASVIDSLYLDTDVLLADGTRPLTANWDVGAFQLTAANLVSDVAIGTQPYACISTTVNTNLNADLWDGYHFTDYLDQAVKTTSSPTFVNMLSGTYTPTLTNVANLDASTASQCQYMRVGSVVTVSGKVSVDPTLTAVSTQLGISLPVASNFGNDFECAGTAFASGIAGQGAAILADAANNRAQMQWLAGDITNQPLYFSFSYTII